MQTASVEDKRRKLKMKENQKRKSSLFIYILFFPSLHSAFPRSFFSHQNVKEIVIVAPFPISYIPNSQWVPETTKYTGNRSSARYGRRTTL